MISLDTLTRWLAAPAESEHLEFKEAKQQFDPAKVRAIWTTPAFVDYVWAARKDLPAETVKKFADAFLTLDMNDPAEKAVLDLQGAKKFVPARAEDFAVIEQVGRSTGLLK